MSLINLTQLVSKEAKKGGPATRYEMTLWQSKLGFALGNILTLKAMEE